MKCQELSFGQVTFKRLLASGGGVAEAGRWASLLFRGDIKTRESRGVSVEEAFEALRLGEITMEVSVDREGKGPKIELVDSYH